MKDPWVLTILCLSLLGTAPFGLRAQENSPKDILFVANNGVSITTLTLGEVREIFLKKRTSWNGIDEVAPLNQPDKSELRDAFRTKVLRMSENEETRYWEQIKIRTGVDKPKTFNNILKAVFCVRGSLGYVYRSEYKEGTAKVVAVMPALMPAL